MGIRRKGREIVLQTLYNCEFFRPDIIEDESLADQKKLYIKIWHDVLSMNDISTESPISKFGADVLDAVLENTPKLDKLINSRLDKTSIDKLSVLDRNLLRIAVGEILIVETPPPVVINEAIEISKKYCSEHSRKLINGVLDKLTSALKSGVVT